MAKFSFGKRKTDDDADLPDSLDGEDSTDLLDDSEESGGRSRRLLILLGLLVILAGGGYLAWNLFMEPAPPPPLSPRPMVAQPMPPAPAPAAKAASPAPAPVTLEAKPTTPVVPAKPEKAPAKTVPAPVKSAVKPATAPAAPAKPEKSPAKAVPGSKTAPPAAAKKLAGPTNFSLQIGAMVMEDNAESLKRRLGEQGVKATIRKGTAYLTKHVVTVGEFGGKREAEELSRRLSVDGFPSQILAADGKFAPQVGSFFNLDEAIDLARELQKKNHTPKIASKPANTVVYQVRHGTFDSRAGAAKRSEELRAKGFNSVVVRE